MQVRLKLFFEWGIVFPDQLYEVPDKGNRTVAYARKEQLQKEMAEKYPTAVEEVAEQPPQKIQRDKHFQKPRNNGRCSEGGAVMSETDETGGESIEGIRDDLSGRGVNEGGDDLSIPAG